MLLVSHDRALLDAVASRLLAVEDGRLVSYPGGWADYVRAQEADGPPRRPRRRRRSARSRSARRSRSRAPIELVEAEVARAEARVAELERKLADDWHDAALVAAHRDARDDLAGADQPLGSAVRSERIDDSVIGSRTRIASSAPGLERAPRARPRARPASTGGASGWRAPLARSAVDRDEQARAALAPRAGSRPARSHGFVDACVQRGEALGAVAERVEPRVPPRRRAAASPPAGAARCRRPSAAAAARARGRSTASSSRSKRPSNVTRSPARSRRI